uniref:Uncharacterized protein n=1 Tax=Loa loa TaxID=7209 RepID=A0A1I7VHZ8_LOALO
MSVGKEIRKTRQRWEEKWVGQHAVAIKQQKREVREESVVVDKAGEGLTYNTYVRWLDDTCDTHAGNRERVCLRRDGKAVRQRRSGKRVRLRRDRSSQVSSNGTSSFDGIHVGVFLGMPDPQDGCRRKRKYSEGQPSVAPIQQLLNQHHQQQQQHQLMPTLANTPSNHTVSFTALAVTIQAYHEIIRRWHTSVHMTRSVLQQDYISWCYTFRFFLEVLTHIFCKLAWWERIELKVSKCTVAFTNRIEKTFGNR